MSPVIARRRETLIDRLDPPARLNYPHFRLRHLAAELLRSGLVPGSEAPAFDLPTSDGGRRRLADLRGTPVLLHFVSYTCPVTRGGAPAMRELHRLYGGQVEFLEILVRQAHPGERRGAYGSFDEKREDACRYASEERTSWPVLVDDLDGTVQRAYGGLAAAVYLIDRDGTVAFTGTWGHSPTLRGAIDRLLGRGGVGPIAGGAVDRRPHLAAAIVAGRRGPALGGRRALLDLELGFPSAHLLMGLGYVARPILAPLAIRTTPIRRRTRLASAAVGILAILLAGRRRRLSRTTAHHLERTAP